MFKCSNFPTKTEDDDLLTLSLDVSTEGTSLEDMALGSTLTAERAETTSEAV